MSRHFGRRRALSHVTLTCRAGEIVGLLGPNGAGKSTLLSILATLLAPSSGEVRYGGDRPPGRAGAARRASACCHDLHLYPELTARENLEFFARLYGLPTRRRAWPRALERAGLADRADDVVSGFSRGHAPAAGARARAAARARGCCCSTSRSPASTTRRRRAGGAAARSCARRAASSSWRRTTSTSPKALLDRGGGAARRPAAARRRGAERCASATGARCTAAAAGPRRGWTRDDDAQFLRVAWLVMRKDLTVEVSSREILYTTVFFAVSCVLVFAFALVREGRPLEDAAAGILWIAIAFAGTLALGRTFERERHAETLRALMLAPPTGRRSTSASCSASLALLAAVEAVLVPLVGLLFQAPFCARPLLAARAAGCRDARVCRRRARCSPRCSCGRAAATCCCRSCCIRSRFRSSSPASAARRRCLQATPDEPMARCGGAAGVLRRRVRHACRCGRSSRS